MICTCYDAYFGKVFNAELNNIITKTKLFNEKVKNKGYVFAREYLDFLEDLSEDVSTYRPSDYLLDNFGFQIAKDDFIKIENGLLNGVEVVIIRPWGR